MIDSNRGFWDGFAGRYDGFMRRFADLYDQVIPEIVSELEGAKAVADVATGTGAIALALAEHVPDVHAIDFSAEMVKLAEEKAAADGKEKIYWRVGRADDLPWDTASLDAVVCANALHVFDSPRSALEEFLRVLKPGGRLVSPTFCHGENLRSRFISRVMGLSGFRAYTRFSVESLGFALEEAGFTVYRSMVIDAIIPLCLIAATKPDR